MKNFALRFLSWFCPEHLYEEIEGDLIQKFIKDVDRFGNAKANRRLLWNVIRFLRPGIILRNKLSRPMNSLDMLLNYFKASFRTIKRNQLYSFLNIIGLALGMAAFLFIAQYVAYEKSFDRFHTNQQDLYRITYSYSYFKNNTTTNSAAVPPRIAPFMKETMSDVKAFARVRPYPGLVISYKDIKIRQDRVLIVDPDFLKIFTFPLVSGNPDHALDEISTVVITESTAKKYFGDEEPVGKIIAVDGIEQYKITGVAKDVPENSHLKFDFLIAYKTIDAWTEGEAETSWWVNEYYEYVLLKSETNISEFEKKFGEIFDRERLKINRSEDSRQSFQLQPITDVHLYSKLDKEPEPGNQGDPTAIKFLSIIGVFILLISWVNYMNLFTARAMERAKEVGIRKTAGAVKSQLIWQFMIESLVVNGIAIIVTLMIVALGIPYFNLLTRSSLDLEFLAEPSFWQTLAVFLIIGSIVAGLYPAFVLSSYRPIAVLKGKLSANGPGIILRRILVVFQFAASVSLIAGTIIVYLQLDHMKKTDLGFDQSEVIVIRGPGVREDEIELTKNKNAAFINEVAAFPEVRSITGGSMVPGREILDGVVLKRKEDPETFFKFVQCTWVGYDYFSTLGVKTIAGRNFSREMKGDTMSLVLNVSAVKALGFSSPDEAINQKLSFGIVQTWTLIGVIDDFNQMSVHGGVKPMAFMMYAGYSPFYIVRFAKGDHAVLNDKLKRKYESFYPRDPYDYFFLDEFFNLQYHKEQRFSSVFALFATFAIIVSCLGLFGLSSFTTLQRTKEIGIRKVLGATISNIAYLLSKEFIVLVALANVIAWPGIYFVMNGWLGNFATRITIGPLIFIWSGLLVVLIAIGTVSYKTLMTAKTDPVKALRYE